MPLVHVNRRAGRPREENAGVREGIHAAIVGAFKTPMHDRTQLLSEHDAAHFEIPADRTAAYTLIEITAFPGRSVDAKRALYRGIVARLEAIGIAPADVLIATRKLEHPRRRGRLRRQGRVQDRRLGSGRITS